MNEVNGKMIEIKNETLSDFIKENHDLLTAMGVFGGLTALFTRIEPEGMGNFLAFWSFTIFFVLSWELYTKFPKLETFNNRLVLFQLLLISLSVTIFLYLLLVYTAYSLIFGSLYALLFSSAIIVVVYDYTQKHKTIGKILGLVLMCLATAGFGLLGLAIIGIIMYLLGLR
jgi:hypothetical protein